MRRDSKQQTSFTASFLVLLLLAAVAVEATANAQKRDTNNQSPIKKVIVLCMENHSFDNMLGWMEAPIGDLTGEEFNLLDPQDQSSQKYFTQRGSAWATLPDPPHLFPNVNKALYGKTDYPAGNTPAPDMSGFAWQYSQEGGNPQNIMNCYTPEQVPIISTLAREFKVMNRWFASVPGPTDINKFFLHGATAGGNTQNCLKWYCYGYPVPMRTIYNSLEEEGYSWRIHWMDWCEAMAITPLSESGADNFIHDQDFTQFFASLNDNTLADYTFLIPRLYRDSPTDFANSQHPFEDVRHGEELMKQVYENLRASPYWEESLLLIVYDEHGGFWDKIVPPGNVQNPTPEFETGRSAFDWTRLGVRVPAIAISPWLAKGVIDYQQYEHSSVPATVKALFNLNAPYLTIRDEQANHFVHPNELLKEPRQDTPKTLPPVPISVKDSYVDADESFAEYSTQPVRSITENQLYLMGTMLVKKGRLTFSSYKTIMQKIVTEDDAVQFCAEAARALGFKVRNDRRMQNLRFLEHLIKTELPEQL